MPDNKKKSSSSIDVEYEKARAARILELSREWGVPTTAIFSQRNNNATSPYIAPGASTNYWTFDAQGNIAKSIQDKNPLPLGQSSYTPADIQLQQQMPGRGMTVSQMEIQQNPNTGVAVTALSTPSRMNWGGKMKNKKWKRAQNGMEIPNPYDPYSPEAAAQYLDETLVPINQDIQRMTYFNDAQPIYGNNAYSIDSSLQNPTPTIPLQNPQAPQAQVGNKRGKGVNFGSVNINLGAAITGLAGAANQAFAQANTASQAARNQRLTLQQEAYNPNPYGTGSSALFKDGGKIPEHVFDLSPKDIKRLESMGYIVEKLK